MARPAGHKLNTRAWDDILRITGRSLTQVAAASNGIPRATVSGLVTGSQRASVPMAFKLAEAVGVHPETLFPTLAGVTAVANTDAA